MANYKTETGRQQKGRLLMNWIKNLAELGTLYIKIENNEHREKVQKLLISNAINNNVKIRSITGCWINPETCETNKVMKVELLSELPKKKKKIRIDERDLYITKLYKEDGVSINELVRRYGLSKQRIYQIIRRISFYQSEGEI